MYKNWILAFACLLLLVALPAGAVKEEQREKVRRQMDSVRIWKLTEELGLSEEQAQAFVPALKEYAAQKADLRRRDKSARAELERLLERPEDRQAIAAQLDHIHAIEREQGKLELDHHRRISEILTLEQEARYQIVQKRIDRWLRKEILDLQRGQGRDSLREWKDRDSSGVREHARPSPERKSEQDQGSEGGSSRSSRSSRQSKDGDQRSTRSGKSR